MTLVTPAAMALKPLLNRLVFHGIQTCRGEQSAIAPRVRSPATSHVGLFALSTTALERVAPELSVAGFIRTRRHPHGDEWTYDQVRMTLNVAADGDSDSPISIVREYALLLTRAVAIGESCIVRVSAPAPQLALFWQAHEASNASVIESEWMEDVIELVVRREEILNEVATAPAELRTLIAQSASRFLTDDSCRWVLRRSLPDAHEVPAFADQVLERFMRLSAAGRDR